MAATEVADVRFLRRQKKIKAPDPSILHADARLDDLKRRVNALDNVRTVVTVRTRPAKQ